MRILQNNSAGTAKRTEAEGKVSLTMLMRKYEDNGETYFVAECLEISGCVADGDTEDKAAANLSEAIRECVEVIFEDSLRLAAKVAAPDRDYVGITSQRTVKVAIPELRVA